MTEFEFISAFNRPWLVNTTSSEPFFNTTRPAAVLIALNPKESLEVIFTTRSSHLKHHAGQISFPGGKAEELDNTLIDTACREAHEEIGLAPSLVNIIGAMPNYKTISGFSVTPIVASLAKPVDVEQELTLDFNEVEDVFTVPLPYLLDLKNYFVHEITRGHEQFPVYFIKYNHRTIWGATAGMMARLAQHVSDK